LVVWREPTSPCCGVPGNTEFESSDSNPAFPGSFRRTRY
jgi:hypothetical protein